MKAIKFNSSKSMKMFLLECYLKGNQKNIVTMGQLDDFLTHSGIKVIQSCNRKEFPSKKLLRAWLNENIEEVFYYVLWKEYYK